MSLSLKLGLIYLISLRLRSHHGGQAGQAAKYVTIRRFSDLATPNAPARESLRSSRARDSSSELQTTRSHLKNAVDGHYSAGEFKHQRLSAVVSRAAADRCGAGCGIRDARFEMRQPNRAGTSGCGLCRGCGSGAGRGRGHRAHGCAEQEVGGGEGGGGAVAL